MFEIFAKHLVAQASIRGKKAVQAVSADDAKDYDPVSVISLNWDSVLDRAIYQELGERDRWNEDDYAPNGVVDYCCYISSIERHAKRIRPGLWAMGARGYNVKLLKIHGSMNWRQCTNCQRLFVAFDELKPRYRTAESCRHCEKHGIDAKFRDALVMPTFLKDLSNFQIKLVWQNAGVELMEARKLVFIGYSLPQADFEFRQLLTRMLHKDASVHVVLYEKDTPEGKQQFKAERDRYEHFFSGHHPTFESGGVVEFVKSLHPTQEN